MKTARLPRNRGASNFDDYLLHAFWLVLSATLITL